MKMTKSFLQGLAHCVFWVIGFLVASKLMTHSEARIAYGYLTGWWAALYFGYIGKSGYAVCSTTHHRLWLSTNQNFTGSRGAIYSLFHQPIEQ